MAQHVVSVRAEYLTQDLGLWCNTCMLPSGIRVWVAIYLGPRMHLQERLWCDEHEGSRGVVAET